MFSLRFSALALLLFTLGLSLSPAVHGYIDGAPEALTLPQMLLEFPAVGVYEVDRVDLERGAIFYKPVEWLQGQPASGIARHIVGAGAEFKKVKPGDRAVILGPDPYSRGLTLVAGNWYIANIDRSDGWWRNAQTNFDLNCCFRGSVAELVDAIRTLHLGKDVTVRSQVKRFAAPTQWVNYNLREAKRKTIVPEPVAAAETPMTAKAPVAQLTSQLRDPSLDLRIAAAAGLTRWGVDAKPATSALIELVATEKDAILRRLAIIALGRIEGDARSALPGLIALVQGGYEDVNALVGAEAVVAIRKIDPRGEAALPLLAQVLEKSPSIDARRHAVRTIGSIGMPLKNAQPFLLARLKSDIDADVRFGAAYALVAIQAEKTIVVPALIDALKDKSEFVRMSAARGLGALGDASISAIPHLKRALNDSDAEVRQYAEQALTAIPKE